MITLLPYTILASSSLVQAATITYAIPTTAPTSASILDPAPIGVSLEFFAFPSYFKNVSNTFQCLQNLQALSGVSPPLRIGGTTQDRAVYDSSLDAYVSYSVPNYTVAPSSLTFGPSFMTLAGTYNGTVVLGLNRGHDDISNTIAAAKVAKDRIKNLLAIELDWSGNQPQPIASHNSPWNPSSDARSQNLWALTISNAVAPEIPLIQAGSSLITPPTWGAAELIATQNNSVLSTIRSYSHHNYPGGTISALQSHVSIVQNLGPYITDSKAAMKVSKEYVLGETNSVSGGGAEVVSPTFGAALWVLDYSLRAVTGGIKRLYFHHGTVGNCWYCWWGRGEVMNPYFGAYVAASAVAGGRSIAALDGGAGSEGGYAVFGEDGRAKKALLVNTAYFAGSGTRGSTAFVLTGWRGEGNVRAKRLTAQSATSRADSGQKATFGGQAFDDATCKVSGKEVFETLSVIDGKVSIVVKASEAVLVYLD